MTKNRLKSLVPNTLFKQLKKLISYVNYVTNNNLLK